MTPLMTLTGFGASPLLFKVATRDAAWVTRSGDTMPLPGYKAIIGHHPSGPQPLIVVRSTYKLITNHELFTAIENTMLAEMSHHVLRGCIIKDTVAYGGRDAFREYLFPHLNCVVEEDKRPIAFRIVVQNSYGGGAIKVLAGAIDFFCTNGMVSGAYEAAYARHTSGVQVDRFGKVIADALIRFITQGERWRRWHATQVTDNEAMELLRSLASSPRNHDALYHQYLGEVVVRGNNLWSVYSAATYAATHNAGEFLIKRGVDNEASILNTRERAVAKWVECEVAFADA